MSVPAFLFVLLSMIVIYDVGRYIHGGMKATISDYIRVICSRYPWVGYAGVYALGMLTWHLIFGQAR